MDIRTIGVVGAGQMGNGIAQVAAVAGCGVIMRDIDMTLCKKGLAVIEKSLGKLVEKEKLSAADRDAAIKRIQLTAEIRDLASCDIAVEAATERVDLKIQIFKELDATLPKQAILATNTSSISITRIASATSRPDKVIGMHFMNPVPIMKGVEIIRGLATSDETAKVVEVLAAKFGKTVVRSNDAPGFIANRVLMPMINEAAYCVMEGVASAEAVDAVMKLGMNHPMGPLELADLIGLDVCLDILEVLYTGFADSKYRPCPLLRKMVAAGWNGRKSGRGFHTYPG